MACWLVALDKRPGVQHIGISETKSTPLLITKAQFCSVGKEYFHDTVVDVATDGRPHLGTPVGTLEYLESFTIDKILSWISAVDILSSIAMSQPHAAYSCFTDGLINCWLYAIWDIFKFPETYWQSLTSLDWPPGALLHSLFALPTRFGGLGIVAPDSLSLTEFSASMYVTVFILFQNNNLSTDSFELSLAGNQAMLGREVVHFLQGTVLKAYSNPPESSYFGTGKGCFQLACCTTCLEAWFLFVQDHLSRCPCFKVWLDAIPYTIPLSMWH